MIITKITFNYEETWSQRTKVPSYRLSQDIFLLFRIQKITWVRRFRVDGRICPILPHPPGPKGGGGPPARCTIALESAAWEPRFSISPHSSRVFRGSSPSLAASPSERNCHGNWVVAFGGDRAAGLKADFSIREKLRRARHPCLA